LSQKQSAIDVKGFAVLVQALTDLRLTNVRLISVGDGETTNGSVPSTHLGFIDNDWLLSQVYSAADLLVLPSFQDNLPSSNTGGAGIPDMIRPGITGMLAPLEDAVGLRTAMIELLRSPDRQATMAAACRRVVMQEFTFGTSGETLRRIV
jgi:glycosyltransferase involved in cell wall biosynthesis